MKRTRWLLVMSLLMSAGFALTASASEAVAGGITEKMTHLMLQLAAIVFAAKVGGLLCSRFLRIPEVLGELASGVLIGPYALGPLLGLFIPPDGGGFPISPELYGIATLASILLLYLAGLETDLAMFLRYSLAGTVVGLGGVVVSFALGDAVAVWAGLASSYMDPKALFLGTISTATSVGITARIMSEKNKMDSPEGVTILAGAVIDDVLGIIILAVVVGMVKVSSSGGHVAWLQIARIAGIALSFWLGCTVLGLLLAKRIAKVLEWFGSGQRMASLSLGLALLLAGLAEKAGLAMIIGAYIMGLSLSRVDCARELQHRLEPVYHTLVSIFFCVMGMMVDVAAMKGMVGFALVYTALAIAAKMLGCGLPALFMRFNWLGALRIGSGMLPRGEVALIVAGIGLANNAVDRDIFGVAILMTLLTTIIAPLLMVKIFDERSGVKVKAGDERNVELEPVVLTLPNSEVAEFVFSRIVQTFELEECYVYQLGPGDPIYQIRKDDMTITVRRDRAVIKLHSADPSDREFARLVTLEAVAELIAMLESLRRVESADSLRTQLLV